MTGDLRARIEGILGGVSPVARDVVADLLMEIVQPIADERDQYAAAVQRGDALAKAVQLVANQLAMAGLHDHAKQLCFAIDEYEETAP